MKGYSPIMAVQSMTGVSTRLAYSRERSNQKKKEQKKENCHRNRHNIAFGYRFSIASNLL